MIHDANIMLLSQAAWLLPQRVHLSHMACGLTIRIAHDHSISPNSGSQLSPTELRPNASRKSHKTWLPAQAGEGMMLQCNTWHRSLRPNEPSIHSLKLWCFWQSKIVSLSPLGWITEISNSGGTKCQMQPSALEIGYLPR